VIGELVEQGITQEELERTVMQLKSSVLMGLESTSSRMSTIARNEMTYGRSISEDEIAAGFDAVTCESVLDMARKVLDKTKMSFSAVGKIRTEEEYKNALGL
ncbi:MAG: insulinase family protein, partial [Clostridia bacterium]|nr:insulinase family protein [Clostridia bacterium]